MWGTVRGIACHFCPGCRIIREGGGPCGSTCGLGCSRRHTVTGGLLLLSKDDAQSFYLTGKRIIANRKSHHLRLGPKERHKKLAKMGLGSVEMRKKWVLGVKGGKNIIIFLWKMGWCRNDISLITSIFIKYKHFLQFRAMHLQNGTFSTVKGRKVWHWRQFLCGFVKKLTEW